MMEVVSSSQTSVNIYKTTRCNQYSWRQPSSYSSPWEPQFSLLCFTFTTSLSYAYLGAYLWRYNLKILTEFYLRVNKAYECRKHGLSTLIHRSSQTGNTVECTCRYKRSDRCCFGQGQKRRAHGNRCGAVELYTGRWGRYTEQENITLLLTIKYHAAVPIVILSDVLRIWRCLLRSCVVQSRRKFT
jgi:hypothetical protein